MNKNLLRMKFVRHSFLIIASAVFLPLFQVTAHPQSADGPAADRALDAATLLKPSADSWPMYHGTYSGQHHSKLAQITPANVYQLTLAWAFETGQTAGLIEVMKCFSPIVHPGGAIPSPAIVERVSVREGQEVRSGQILFVLRPAT